MNLLPSPAIQPCDWFIPHCEGGFALDWPIYSHCRRYRFLHWIWPFGLTLCNLNIRPNYIECQGKGRNRNLLFPWRIKSPRDRVKQRPQASVMTVETKKIVLGHSYQAMTHCVTVKHCVNSNETMNQHSIKRLMVWPPPFSIKRLMEGMRGYQFLAQFLKYSILKNIKIDQY